MPSVFANASNGSGDYVIAFSTVSENRISYRVEQSTLEVKELHNDKISPLFLAVIEATEEAILKSLFTAETMEGNGNIIEAFPKEKILKMMKED
ncbi:MAG: P1 family peptidase [Bacteroidetes bacterium]|nr:P1 family peptidase [Bacteroidota bacterium]